MRIKRCLYYLFAVIASGVTAGLAGVFFTYLIHLAHNFFFLHEFSVDFSNLSHTNVMLSPLTMIITPAIGGLFVVYITKNFAPEAKGHGVPEVMYAISKNNSKIRTHVAIVKAFASATSLGSGGSGGMEGPIVQIGAALSAIYNYIFSWLTSLERATLVACGVAGGYASGFNAPIAGVLFALELIVPKITIKTTISIITSVIISIAVTHLFVGDHKFFVVHKMNVPVVGGLYYLLYGLLGVFTGVMAAIFISALKKSEDYFDRLKYDKYTIHGVAMLILGVLTWMAVKFTGYYESGYAAIIDVMYDKINYVGILVFLLFYKVIVTCLTLASGGSGGVFSPSLFMGSMVGAIFYLIILPHFPVIDGQMLNFIIAAMAGVAAGTSASVLGSVAILIEITGDDSLIIVVLITSIASHLTRRLLLPYSIYTYKHYQPKKRKA